MDKQFQKVKIFMIFIMLFCSSLLIIMPIGKAGPLDQIYECIPSCVVEYNESLLKDPIIPYSDPITIPITVKTKVTGPADDIVVDKLGPDGIKYELIVYLSIDEVPEGCHASIAPPLLKSYVTSDFTYSNATISLTLNKELPASAEKKIVVRMATNRIGSKATLVKARNFTKEIPFTVGYLPQLSFTYPDGNVKNIEPDETAYFTMEIQNWGNGITKVNTEIVDIPEGWLTKIVQNTTLGTYQLGTNNKKTISLNVKPPVGFGYHEDRAVIKVKMTPVYFEDQEIKGEPHYLYFIVQSKGFSTPGFEMITLLFAFIFIMMPIIKRKNSKSKEKNHKGGKN